MATKLPHTRQPIGEFSAPDGRLIPVTITTPWLEALQEVAADASDGTGDGAAQSDDEGTAPTSSSAYALAVSAVAAAGDGDTEPRLVPRLLAMILDLQARVAALEMEKA